VQIFRTAKLLYIIYDIFEDVCAEEWFFTMFTLSRLNQKAASSTRKLPIRICYGFGVKIGVTGTKGVGGRGVAVLH
jgi:hypothetical protein